MEPSTFHEYEWAVERHIAPLIGAVHLRDLSSEAVDRCLTALVADVGNGKARLRGRWARLVRKVLSTAMDDAVRRGRIPRNPVAMSQPPKRSTVRTRMLRRLEELSTIPGSRGGPSAVGGVPSALVTWLRRGELLGLRWQHVDLGAGDDRGRATARGRVGPAAAEGSQDGGKPSRAGGRSGTMALPEKHRVAQSDEATFAGRVWQARISCSRPSLAGGSTGAVGRSGVQAREPRHEPQAAKGDCPRRGRPVRVDGDEEAWVAVKREVVRRRLWTVYWAGDLVRVEVGVLAAGEVVGTPASRRRSPAESESQQRRRFARIDLDDDHWLGLRTAPLDVGLTGSRLATSARSSRLPRTTPGGDPSRTWSPWEVSAGLDVLDRQRWIAAHAGSFQVRSSALTRALRHARSRPDR